MNGSNLARGAAFSAGAALILAGGLLAGACGGDDDSTATTTAQATTQATRPTVTDQRARATVNDTTAVYFTVKNVGVADRLVSVKADPAVAGMAQVHETIADGASMKMQEVKAGIEVPANGTLELKPGGYHVMLMNVTKPLSVGDSLKLDLVFEKAGTILDCRSRRPGRCGDRFAVGGKHGQSIGGGRHVEDALGFADQGPVGRQGVPLRLRQQ